LLEKWNDTGVAYPRDLRVHEVFEVQVERDPDAVAVVFGSEVLSYGELNARANRLARDLEKRGVGPEVLVGLCVERSLEMVVGMLGILKAGGAYVPLDPEYPKERLAFMLEDTRAPVLLTQERLVGGLPECGAEVVCLDADAEAIAVESEANLSVPGMPDDLAYVIYTSGSTGRPKGIGIPHRAISRLVLNTDYVDLDASDRIAQASNCSFDAATFEIWGALLHGGRLVGIGKDVMLMPRDFAAALREHEISVVFLTTALFNQVAREVPDAFRSVRHLLFGGEAVDPQWVREVLANGSPQRLLHVYGPTESTTFTTWYRVESIPEGATTVPIGRPIANTQLYVLDGGLQPVPVGVPGELYIGGDGLARGYLDRPELTAEKFIPHPFGAELGSRLYRTGDRVRALPSGDVEFLGRIDHQVKVRGYRIELGEVEAVLGRHPAVRDGVVLAREDLPGEKRLVAYVVSGEEPAPGSGELRSFLRQTLPDYMVPSAFVPLASLPLTPNGKIDRSALPPPDGARPELEDGFVAPRTPLEKVLVGIWCELLEMNRVGVHDNFFELGGHSLLATQMVWRVQDILQVDVPLRSLFQAPTVSEQANVIAESYGGREVAEEVARALAKLEQLSDDDVRMELTE
jgi:amino acid adenylation domain-containing protein